MSEKVIKVAAATPEIRVADVDFNREVILRFIEDAEKQGVNILCFPELCLTGCTCGDLFLHDVLISGAERALEDILARTEDFDVLFTLGMPVRREGRLYNCAAVCKNGKPLWLVPKSMLSSGEMRWFAADNGIHEETVFAGCKTWFSCYSGFKVCGVPTNVAVGDRAYDSNWSQIVLNLAADYETMGRAQSRHEEIKSFTAQTGTAIIRAGAGLGESTTDAVYAGHCIITSKGEILAEKRFESGLIVAEIGVNSVETPSEMRSGCAVLVSKKSSTSPFAPKSGSDCEDALRIAARGLASRMRHIGAEKAVIGVSGGLDSTLALLICARAVDELDLPRENIVAITMPGFGTTGRTKKNAVTLAKLLGAALRTISIEAAVRQHFADIGYDENDRGIVFENAQARERTQILMDVANGCGGLVVGTGDMSELALGWATYNGDHMSMYGVNAGIPKTLVRALVSYVAETDAALAVVLRDVLETPVSPELLPGAGGQMTEDIIGPYELHDFFLYHLAFLKHSPREVFGFAQYAFEGIYGRDEILKWMNVFVRRFFSQQFKRNCMPDGPQILGFSLSPRSGLVMPSDAVAALWLRELEEM